MLPLAPSPTLVLEPELRALGWLKFSLLPALHAIFTDDTAVCTLPSPVACLGCRRERLCVFLCTA